MYISVIKRFLDIIISFIIIIIIFPVLLLSALVVINGDGFPIFYLQDRVGLNGTIFKVFKLRTMKLGMSNLGTTSFEDDPRYFFGSRFLRGFKIDELPQVFNILKGDMSLVGPRPTVQEDYEKMSEVQRQRFSITPGLTGLAQVSGNTSLKWPERVKLDIYYIDNCSLLLDVKILFKTFMLLVSNRIDTNPPESGEW